jgi:integrase
VIHKLPSLKPFKHPSCKWRVNYTALDNGRVKRLNKAFKEKKDAEIFYKFKLNEYKVYNLLSMNELVALMPALNKWIDFTSNHPEIAHLEQLDDIVRVEVERLKQRSESQKLGIVLESFLEGKIAKYYRKTKQTKNVGDHCRSLRSRLNKLIGFFGDSTLISDISINDANNFITCLYEDYEMEGRTVYNHRSSVISLFNYALKHGYISENVFEKTDPPEMEDKEIYFYSLSEMEDIWWKACPDIKVAVLLQAFCGVRSGEYKNMHWSDIEVEKNVIYIRGNIGKRGRKRSIILDAFLSERLGALKEQILGGDEPFIEFKDLGKVEDESLDDMLESIIKGDADDDQVEESRRIFDFGEKEYKIKLDKLISSRIDNGFRHSFGTYHYALKQDWMKTTEQMGNSKSVLMTHYNGLSSQKEAENYFNIVDDLNTPSLDVGEEYTNDAAELSLDEIADLSKEHQMSNHPKNRRIHKD